MAYRYARTFYGQELEKDQLLLQLSKQLDALRMNQQDYALLESQAQVIREKYAGLQAEKERVQQNLIAKNELLERQVTDNQRETQRLRTEVKLSREQLEDTVARRDELASEVRHNEVALSVLEKEKATAVESEKNLERERRQLEIDLAAINEDIAKWELLKAEYVDQISTYKAKKEDLRRDIEQAKQADANLDQRILNALAQTKTLEELLAKTEDSLRQVTSENQRLTEELKQQKIQCLQQQSEINRITEETNHYGRLLQFEEKKEKELTLALSTLSVIVDAANASFDQKQAELTEYRRRNQLSRDQERTLEEENHRLEQLHKNLTKHLTELAQQNSRLESEVERVFEEDREIRQLLSNKALALQPYHKENREHLQPQAKSLSQSRSTTGNGFFRSIDA